MKKSYLFYIIFFALFMSLLLVGLIQKQQVEDSIIYFPLNESVTFLDAETSLLNPVTKGKREYDIILKSYSRLDQEAYLRQDISFLFVNGRLFGKMGKWENKTDVIENEEKFSLKNNHLLQAISYHHGELHENDNITSTQRMSKDGLYVVHSALGLIFFHKPQTEEETGFKDILDKKVQEVIQYNLKMAEEQFNINLENYHVFPIIELPELEKKGLPSFSKEKSAEILGKLWEGLYKNYFVAIKKGNGESVSPIASTMPIIFLSKSKDHLYVIFETADGEGIQLLQRISP